MRRYLALVLGLLAMLIAGCGGGSHPAPSPSHQQSCRTPQGVTAHACGFGHEKVPNLPRALAPTATATPTVEMFDSIQANIPSGAQVAAGYTSGYWPTYGLFVRLYPHARIISIAISASHQAHCLDVEPGDASPSQVVFWVGYERAHGDPKPCIYASLSTWYESIFSDLAGGGISRASIWKWDAHYDYFAHIDASFDATQWTDQSRGQNLDESTVTLAFAGLGKPAPPPDPYAIYPRTVFRLAGGVRASEHGTVSTWHAKKCEDPARRPVCRSTYYHARLLRDRLYYVAHHPLLHGHASYGIAHRGPRLHGLSVIVLG